MRFLHQELRQGREKAGLSQQALVGMACRAAPPLPDGDEQQADVDSLLLLHRLRRIAGEIEELEKDVKIES